MKIECVAINGIKSHVNTKFNLNNDIDDTKYCAFVGENNSGKSNVLTALRWFFKDYKLQYSDINMDNRIDPSVTIKFLLNDNDEIINDIDNKYINNNYLYVKANTSVDELGKKPQIPSYQILSDRKNKELPARIKFGEIIYVPSLRDLNDEVKFTTNSTINKLVSDTIISRVKEEKQKDSMYQKIDNSITEFSDYISIGDNSAISNLKKALKKYMLDYENIELDFKLEPPTVEELFKSSFKPFIKINQNEIPLLSQGMGYQRSLIFSLLCNIADIDEKDNIFKVYLIEEPELFLHPNLQMIFRDKLMDLSRKSNNQVFITTHSPYFVNNTNNYSHIKRIFMRNNISYLKEIDNKILNDICDKNGIIMATAKRECSTKKWSDEEYRKEAEKIAKEDYLRYLLWIDPYRANAFLSTKVLLIEGSTEKALLYYILNNNKSNLNNTSKKTELSVVDVNGKYHFYKFANLLNKLGINVWILYDEDSNKEKDEGISHKILNKTIHDLKNENIIIDYFECAPYLEKYLNINKTRTADISLYSYLCNNTEGLNTENFNKINKFIKNIITYK